MSEVVKPILLDETGVAINETLTRIYGKLRGTDISDATATAADILVGKSAYGKNGKIDGTLYPVKTITVTGDGTDTLSITDADISHYNNIFIEQTGNSFMFTTGAWFAFINKGNDDYDSHVLIYTGIDTGVFYDDYGYEQVTLSGNTLTITLSNSIPANIRKFEETYSVTLVP